MKKNNLTNNLKTKIINLYLKKNYSLNKISKQTNLSISVISLFLKKNQIYLYKNSNLTKKELLKNYINKKNIQKQEINKIAICKKTNKKFKDYKNSSGALIIHLKKIYPNLEIPSKFLRYQFFLKNNYYWHEKYFSIVENHEKHLKCRLCNWETTDSLNKSGAYTKHLKNKHSINIKDYIKLYPQDKELFNSFIKKQQKEQYFQQNSKNWIKCQICGKLMKKITNTHLKKHNLTLKEYKKKYKQTLSETSKEKFIQLSKTLNNHKRKFGELTSIEKLMLNKLSELNIKFEYEKKVDKYYFDFYLKKYNLYIEVDGDYWHGNDRTENWSFTQFNNVINDYHKSNIVNNLYRIKESIITKKDFININTKEKFFDFIKKNNFNIKNHLLFNLKENQIIFSKSYCIKNKEISEKTIKNFYFFIKNFYPPHIYKSIIDINNRHASTSKLKAILFESFYKAHKIKHKNLIETFNDEKRLKRAINYRLGLNNSNEFFNVTIKEIYRGIEVSSLFHVSIFPVKQAKEIYSKYIKENYNVFDPFAGWGSRALAIKDLKCKYIGYDNNENLKNDYKKIKQLYLNNKKQNITLTIKDSKILNNKLINAIDFIFTSPPFYNDEIYHKNQYIYKTIQEWGEYLLLPVFKNCFMYLKNNSTIIIDMKSDYIQETINRLKEAGFKFITIKKYKINKSHYSNKKTQKYQGLIIAKKNF